MKQVFSVVPLLLLGLSAVCFAAVQPSLDDDLFDNFLYPEPKQVVRAKGIRAPVECGLAYRNLRDRPEVYTMAKRKSYMGIEIPDFITDGQLGDAAGAPQKNRYFKTG